MTNETGSDKMLNAAIKGVLPKDLRSNTLDIRVNVVKEEMVLDVAREVDAESVVRWRQVIICGNA